MRKLGLFLLLAFLTIGSFAVVNAAVTDVAMSPVNIAPNNGAGMVPGRDPVGEDDIFYDDANPAVYWPWGGLFFMVRFTPNSDFRLQSASFMIQNTHVPPIETATKVRVGTVKQNAEQTWMLDQELYVGDYNGPFTNAEWLVHEIPEAEWDNVTFQAGETFGIVVGPNPGPAAPDRVNGYWLLGDASSVVKRSSLTQVDADRNPDPNSWESLPSNDLLIRANGTYLNEFYDLAVLAAWNADQQWMVIPGNSVNLVADIANFGADLGEAEYEINWKVLGPEGQVMKDYSMAGAAVNSGDTLLAFACDQTWDIPVDAPQGRYTLSVSTKCLVADDTNTDNDTSGLDLLVFAPPKAEPDTWFEFIGQDHQVEVHNMLGDSLNGYGTTFNHPGNDLAYRVTKARAACYLFNGAATLPGIRVGIINWDLRQFRWIHEQWFAFDPIEANDSLAWLETEIPADSGVFRKNEGVIVAYLNNAGCRAAIDTRFPISAGISSEKMPFTSFSFDDGGNNIRFTASGDFAAGAMFVEDDSPVPGKHLKLDPPALNFALLEPDSIMVLDREYSIEAWVHSVGDQAITLSNIVVRAEVKNYLTFDPIINIQNKKVIQPGDSLKITVKCTIPSAVIDSIQYKGNNLVLNDGADNVNMPWPVWVRCWDPQSVSETYGLTPNTTALGQNYPNPFNPTTVLPISLAATGNVEVVLMDINGRVVSTVFNGRLTAGIHTFEINGTDLPAGVYMCRMTTGNFTDTRKVLLLK